MFPNDDPLLDYLIATDQLDKVLGKEDTDEEDNLDNENENDDESEEEDE